MTPARSFAIPPSHSELIQQIMMKQTAFFDLDVVTAKQAPGSYGGIRTSVWQTFRTDLASRAISITFGAGIKKELLNTRISSSAAHLVLQPRTS